MADAGRSIDTHHRGVQKSTSPQRSVVVRGIVCPNESDKVRQFFKTIDISYRPVIDNAIPRFGVDGVSDIVADRRSTLLQSEVITGIDIALLQHVYRPGIHSTDPVHLCAFIFQQLLYVRTAWHPCGRERAPNQYLVGMNREPTILILVHEAVLLEYSPRF